MRVEVTRRRRPAQLVPELTQQTYELRARREAARDKPCVALGRVPAAEVLDHRLRMDGRERVRRELPHRRRAAEPVGARLQLVEDLLVRVALAQPRLELGQSGGVDAAAGSWRRLARHDNKDIAS